MKRMIAVALSLVMLLCLMPMGAMAGYYLTPDGQLIWMEESTVVTEEIYTTDGYTAGTQPAGCFHAAGSPVQENYCAPSCYGEGSCDYVTYCVLCGAEMSREHRVLTASHLWAPDGVCTLCGRYTGEETVHVYPSDNLSKCVVYGKVPEGITVKIEPAPLSLQEFAYTLPADTTVTDLEAGEVRIYDISMVYTANGTAFQPDYTLNVTVNPGFEKIEKIHLYHVYEKAVRYTEAGEPVYRTVAEELEPEIQSSVEDGVDVARVTFAASVGERYALYSEGELLKRLAKRLEALPADLSSLGEEDAEKARQLEKQLLAIEEMTATLAEEYAYNELWDSPELNWTVYNYLREVLNAYLGNVEKTIVSEPAEDGTVVTVSGKLPEGAVVVVKTAENPDAANETETEEEISSEDNYFYYDITIFVDGEKWEPAAGEEVKVILSNPNYRFRDDEIRHYEENGEMTTIQSELDEDGNISYITTGFSTFGILKGSFIMLDLLAVPGIVTSGDGWVLYDDGTLEINGTVKSWTNNPPWNGSKTAIKKVVTTEGAKVATCINMFKGCTNLESVDLSHLDTSSVTTMASMFDGCAALTELDLSGLDFSSVTNINNLTNGCSSELKLDMHGVNLSKVSASYRTTPFSGKVDLKGATMPKTSSSFFAACTNLQSVDLSGANFTSTTTMASMFSGCTGLTEVTLGSSELNETLSSVTTMASMFNGCTSLESVTLGELNTSSVTTMASMFSGCEKLNSVTLGGMNSSAVTSMDSMFKGCAALTELDLSGLEFGKVTDIDNFTNGCTSLETLNMQGADLSAVTTKTSAISVNVADVNLQNAKMPKDCSSFFAKCTNLQSVDLTGADFTKTTTMASMFSGCAALTELDLSGLDFSAVTDISNLTAGCSPDLKLDMHGANLSKVSTKTTAFSGDVNLQGAKMPATSSNFFLDCTNLKSVDLSGADFTSTTTMASMFSGCTSLSKVDMGKLNTSSVTTMASMFDGCAALPELDLSGLDFGAVTSITYLTRGCENLGTLNMQGADLRAVTNKTTAFSGDVKLQNAKMPATCTDFFKGCTNLKSVDLSGADFTKTTLMDTMFSGCTGLTSVTLGSNETTSSVTTMASMFSGCTNLSSVTLGDLNTSKVKYMNSMFNNCAALRELDLSGLDFSLVENISTLTAGCSSDLNLDMHGANLAKVNASYRKTPFSGKVNLQGAIMPKNSSSFFANCKNLQSVDLTGADFASTTTMASMFSNCTGLTSVTLGSNETVSSVQTMESMFSGCTSLTSATLGELNTSSVTTMASMFEGCAALPELDLSGLDFSAVKNISYIAKNCSADLNLDMHGADLSAVTTMATASFSGNVDLQGAKMPKLCTSFFESCANLQSVDLTDADFSQTTNVKSMFYKCTNLKNVGIKGCQLPAVKDLTNMFRNCSSLVELDMSGMDLHSVTTLVAMFYGCEKLKTLIMEDVDLSGVTTPYSSGDSGITSVFGENCGKEGFSVDLSRTNLGKSSAYMFSKSNLTNIELDGAVVGNCPNMFQNCKLLQEIDLSETDLSGVTSMSRLFRGCDVLTNVNMSGCSLDSLTNGAGMFGACPNIVAIDMSGVTIPRALSYGVGDTTEYAFATTGTAPDGFTLDLSGATLASPMNFVRSAPNLKTADLTDATISGDCTNMFYNCKGLESIDFTGSDTAGITNATQMFQNIGTDNYNIAFTVSDSSFNTVPAKIDNTFCNNWTWVSDDGQVINTFSDLALVQKGEGLTFYPAARLLLDANGGNFSDGSISKFMFVRFGQTLETYLSEILPEKEDEEQVYTLVGWDKELDKPATRVDLAALITQGDLGKNGTYTLYAEWGESADSNKKKLIDVTVISSSPTVPTKEFKYEVSVAPEYAEHVTVDPEATFVAVVPVENAKASAGVTFDAPGTYKIKIKAKTPDNYILNGNTEAEATVTVEDVGGELVITQTEFAHFEYIYVSGSGSGGEHRLIDDFDLSDAVKTVSLTEEDKTKESQKNYQIDVTKDGTIIKTAKWTDKAKGEAEIDIVAEGTDMGESVAVYFATNCNAHKFNAAVAQKNIETLLENYSRVDVIFAALVDESDLPTSTKRMNQSFYAALDQDDKNGNIESFLAKIRWNAPHHNGAQLLYTYMDDYLSSHNPSTIYVSFDGTEGFATAYTYNLNSYTNQKLAAYQNAGRYFVMISPDFMKFSSGVPNKGGNNYYRFMMLLNPAWTINHPDFNSTTCQKGSGKYAYIYADMTAEMPVVYQDGSKIVDYSESFDVVGFILPESRTEKVVDIVDKRFDVTEDDIEVITLYGEKLERNVDYTLALNKETDGTKVTVEITNGILFQPAIVRIHARTDRQYATADNKFDETNIGNAAVEIVTTYTQGDPKTENLAVKSPKLYRTNGFLNYVVLGDDIYGVPSDSVTPDPVSDIFEGTVVTLAPQPTTAWTSSDGTAKGYPGEWTFYPNATETVEEGWNYNPDEGEPLSGSAVKEVTMPDQTVTVYGKWVFKESPRIADLIIRKEIDGNLYDATDSFIFHITGGSGEDKVDMYVTIQGEGSETIVELPINTYKVTEVSGIGNWSWRYKQVSVVPEGGTVTLVPEPGDGDNTVTFTNMLSDPQWLGGSTLAVNTEEGRDK